MNPANPTDDALALPPGHIINHYRISRVIGRGGFGITYAAEDIHTGTELAVKELLPASIATRTADFNVIAHSSSQHNDFRWAIQSFIQEAQTLTKFNHPHLVRMLEYFEQNGTAYMVMPYIRGDDLKAVVKKHGPFSEQEAIQLLQAMLSALDAIHSAGFLHRDIKPENIILQEPGRKPILLDFGASRNLVSTRSQAMTSIISPGYAPIEQYSTDAKYQGPWSDIYALASVLHFTLSGHPPAEAPERSNAIRHGQADPTRPLHQLRKGIVSRALSNAILHGMQLKERDRPQSIQAWQAELDLSTGTGPPAVALPQQSTGQAGYETDPLYPARPNVPSQRKKRNRPVAVLAILVIMIVSLVSLGGFIGYEHYRKNKQRTRSTADTGKRNTGSAVIATAHGNNSDVSPPSGAPTTRQPALSFDRVRKFVSDYYQAGASGDQLNYYADNVDYFGKNNCSLNEIREDNASYRKLWPKRSYQPESTIEVKEYGNQAYQTTTRLRYRVNNGVEHRTGVVRSNITVRKIMAQPKITVVNNSVIEPATVRYDTKAQEQSAKQFIADFIKSGNSSHGSILRQLDFYAGRVSPYYRTKVASTRYIRDDLIGYARKFPQREYRIIEALRTKGLGRKTVTVFATVSYLTRSTTTRRGNIFNTYEITYISGQPKITSVTSEPIE